MHIGAPWLDWTISGKHTKTQSFVLAMIVLICIGVIVKLFLTHAW